MVFHALNYRYVFCEDDYEDEDSVQRQGSSDGVGGVRGNLAHTTSNDGKDNVIASSPMLVLILTPIIYPRQLHSITITVTPFTSLLMALHGLLHLTVTLGLITNPGNTGGY